MKHGNEEITLEKAAEHLLGCIQDDALEDAFQWTKAINEEIHFIALRRLAKFDSMIDDMKRSS